MVQIWKETMIASLNATTSRRSKAPSLPQAAQYNLRLIWNIKKTNSTCVLVKSSKMRRSGKSVCTHGGTRTPNLRFRRPTPYPLGHAGTCVLEQPEIPFPPSPLPCADNTFVKTETNFQFYPKTVLLFRSQFERCAGGGEFKFQGRGGVVHVGCYASCSSRRVCGNSQRRPFRVAFNTFPFLQVLDLIYV